MGDTFTQMRITALSRYIDESYPDDLSPEAVDWRRIMKIGEEFGEVVEAYGGAIGENPRKGQTHSISDVESELLDVVLAGLGALEHIRGNLGDSLRLLADHAHRVSVRAGLEAG